MSVENLFKMIFLIKYIMPTCLCNREEALEILSQNLYPKTYDKLNEEYDRLKKYNKKLKQIEFYIDIMKVKFPLNIFVYYRNEDFLK